MKKKNTTRMGFEPTRAEPNRLAVYRLNHSATSSCNFKKETDLIKCLTMKLKSIE